MSKQREKELKAMVVGLVNRVDNRQALMHIKAAKQTMNSINELLQAQQVQLLDIQQIIIDYMTFLQGELDKMKDQADEIRRDQKKA